MMNITKSKKNKEIFYQILIDRFSDDNDFKCIVNTNTEIPPQYKGGTINGIIRHLDYIKSLGVTGILLTPFFKSTAYHGYHSVTDKNEINEHFGSKEDILNLVRESEKRNIICGADFVPNHCHRNSPIFKEHKDWFIFPSKSIKYYAGLEELPVLNLDHKEAREYMINQALQLCGWGFDFLRIDHATGPSYSFLFELRKRVKQKYPKMRLIGEVVGEMDFTPLIPLRYENSLKRGLSPQECRQLEYAGILDGVLDYEYYGIVKNFLKTGEKGKWNFSKFKKQVRQHFFYYSKNFELWLFLDNHDVDRILYLCNGNIKILQKLLEFTYSFNKPVVIYYGTEQCMKNETELNPAIPYCDESVRQCINWGRQDENFFKKLYPLQVNENSNLPESIVYRNKYHNKNYFLQRLKQLWLLFIKRNHKNR